MPDGLGYATNGQSYFTTDATAHIGAHIPQSQFSVLGASYLPPQLIKYGKLVAGPLPVQEAAVANAYKQLQCFLLRLLLSLRKAHLLFPAHFFW